MESWILAAAAIIVSALVVTIAGRNFMAKRKKRPPGARGRSAKHKAARAEQVIFDELAALCLSPGYIHAVAYLSFSSNMISYSGEMTSEDMRHMFSNDRLIRTELSTLIGLMLKGDIDSTLPDPNAVQECLDKTEALLDELHRAMSAEFLVHFDPTKAADPDFNPFTVGTVLREPIFYGGESAYSFQYRDLALRKYEKDNDWLLANRGFTIDAAREVARAIGGLQDQKATATLQRMRDTHPNTWTYLPVFTFTAQEIATLTGLDVALVRAVLVAFTVPKGAKNAEFKALNDFNIANASPLVPAKDDSFVLLTLYSLVEALYESPFYWMGADKKYVSTAMQHRGSFTEEFSAECLARVFGKENVYSNVDIFESPTVKAGEIDVLVLFANRAIVLQAKSKRLTLESRRGNDGQIRDDFKKSIQDSYDQAHKCASMLRDSKYTFRDRDSKAIAIPQVPKETYIICAVSDHYPALSFQARQFLKVQEAEGISPPFVLDLFTLDAMTEMLRAPLQLLSYIDRRTKYADRLVASHELTILSYHLKQNLWVSDEHQVLFLHDDVSSDLDLAMLARREGISAKDTPDGILNRLAETTLGRFIREIEKRPDAGTIELGFLLLTLSEDTVIDVSRGIDELVKRCQADGKSHDLTVGLGKGGSGLTIHCNNDPVDVAAPALRRHCLGRKYTEQAKTWFGICVSPTDVSLRFGLVLDFPWERSEELDSLTKGMKEPSSLSSLFPAKPKTRSNDPCPCGSGKKYKRCCLLKR